MRRFIALLVCGLASTASLAAQTDSTAAGTNPLERARAVVERFKLFTGCAQVRLTVALSGETGEEIGLTEERVRTLVESRLRAARLYLSEGTLRGVIIVGVNTLRRGTAFTWDVSFMKMLSDPMTGATLLSETWTTGGLGTHGDDAGYIMQSLSESLDRFVLEYLRVNGDSCE